MKPLSKPELDNADETPPPQDLVQGGELDHVRIPHISIHVFRETDEFAGIWEQARIDRRMTSAQTTIFEGGFPAAILKYTKDKTPDLIIVESAATVDILEYEADCLAEVCDPGTRVIIIGHTNDIHLYQKMISMGVSNYIVYPVTVPTVINAISEVYRTPGHEKIGKVHAVIGARGGVGASTVAHNLALELGNHTQSEVLLIDMDVNFGSAAVNLDVEPNQGLGELVDQAERVDTAMLDRVLIQRGLHLGLIGTTPNLEQPRTLDTYSVERIIDTAASHVPQIVLDIPHIWTDWVQRALKAADNVLVVSTPELGSLKNAATMISHLKHDRPNDQPPMLVVNQAGVKRRLEVSPREIAATIQHEPEAVIPFDPKLFSLAVTRGKLLSEIGARKPAARILRKLAETVHPEGQKRSRLKKRKS